MSTSQNKEKGNIENDISNLRTFKLTPREVDHVKLALTVAVSRLLGALRSDVKELELLKLPSYPLFETEKDAIKRYNDLLAKFASLPEMGDYRAENHWSKEE